MEFSLCNKAAGNGVGGGPRTWCMIVNASALLTFRCLATTCNLSQASSSMGKGKLLKEAAIATTTQIYYPPRAVHQKCACTIYV